MIAGHRTKLTNHAAKWELKNFRATLKKRVARLLVPAVEYGALETRHLQTASPGLRFFMAVALKLD